MLTWNKCTQSGTQKPKTINITDYICHITDNKWNVTTNDSCIHSESGTQKLKTGNFTDYIICYITDNKWNITNDTCIHSESGTENQ